MAAGSSPRGPNNSWSEFLLSKPKRESCLVCVGSSKHVTKPQIFAFNNILNCELGVATRAALQVVVPFGEELAPCSKAARRQTRCGKQLQLQGFSAAHRPLGKQSPRLFVPAVSGHPRSPTEHISAEEWPSSSGYEPFSGITKKDKTHEVISNCRLQMTQNQASSAMNTLIPCRR